MGSQIKREKPNNLSHFSEIVWRLSRSDRDVNIAVGGYTGEGKTTFGFQFLREWSRASGINWPMSHTTWSRKELMLWIDGDKSKPPGRSGLRPGQLPEYSAILVDELFLLFYRRNWFDEGQIDSIATLNMCRDRHLLIIGNIPNFWDLDSAYTSRMRFYVYVPTRGIAWIFQQDNNPFSTDPWNKTLNRTIFQRKHNPYQCPNFVGEVRFPDMTPEEKRAYLEMRNSKRVEAIDLNKDKKERYSKIKVQRDALIRMIFETHDLYRKASKEKVSKLSCKDISDVIDISPEAVRLIYNGDR